MSAIASTSIAIAGRRAVLMGASAVACAVPILAWLAERASTAGWPRRLARRARQAIPRRPSTGRLSRRDPRLAICVLGLLSLSTGHALAKDKPTRFWNLTGDTVTHLSLAPAGTDAYGPDQCANDRDGTVDFDERLPIIGLAPGRYDLRLDLKAGKRCRIRDIEIQAGEVFSIEGKDLVDCAP